MRVARRKYLRFIVETMTASCTVNLLESSLMFRNFRASRPPLRPLVRNSEMSSRTVSMIDMVGYSHFCGLSPNSKVVETAISNATNDSIETALKWGAPVNRENRAAGGLHWSTYKAICRRNGIYTNGQGPHVSHCLSFSGRYTLLTYLFLGMERGAVSIELRCFGKTC